MEESFLNTVLANIDIMYILTCNIITYVILGSLKQYNLSRAMKRLIAAVSAIVIAIGLLFVRIADTPQEELEGITITPLFFSFFMQFFTWDYLFKYVIEFCKNKFQTAAEEAEPESKKRTRKSKVSKEE